MVHRQKSTAWSSNTNIMRGFPLTQLQGGRRLESHLPTLEPQRLKAVTAATPLPGNIATFHVSALPLRDLVQAVASVRPSDCVTRSYIFTT